MEKQNVFKSEKELGRLSTQSSRASEYGIGGRCAPSFNSSTAVSRYAPRIRSSHFWT